MTYISRFLFWIITITTAVILTFLLLSSLPITNPFSSPRTLTVIGTATQKVPNQIARFSVSVTATGEDRKQVLDKVNTKINDIITAVKAFGINQKDIKTQSASFYQLMETYYDKDGRKKTRPGQWQVSNSIEITLRDPDQADDLTKLLNQTGATSVYGPTFSIDPEQTDQTSTQLFLSALENAKAKANQIAQKNHFQIVKILHINETNSNFALPVYEARGIGGGGSTYVPGDTPYTKTVTVVFEIR